MASEVGVGFVRLVPSMRGFSGEAQKQLNSGLTGPAQQAGDKAGRSLSASMAAGLSASGQRLSSAGTKLSLGLSLPLVAGFHAAESAATDLAEAQNATNQVFGDASDVVDEFATDSATSVGLSERAFRQAITPMGSIMQGLGFSQEEAADSSLMLAERAADMASVFNTDVDTALGAVTSALKGERDPIEQFGVSLNAAKVEAEAMALGLADADGEISDNAKTQAALSLIMKQTDKVAGDFTDTIDGNANQQRVMAARAEDAAAAFGDKLVPIKAKLLQVGTKLLGMFGNLTDGQQKVAVGAGLVAIALGPVLKVVGLLARGAAGVIKVTTTLVKLGATAATTGARVAVAFARMVAGAARATARVVASIATQIARWAVMGVQALAHAAKVALAWVISMGPIGIVIAAVAGAAALIIKNWDKIKQFVTTAAKAVVDFLKRHWPLIISIIGGPIGAIVALIIKNWDTIKATTSRVWNAIIDFFKRIPGRVTGAIRAMISGVTGIARDAWNKFREVSGRIVGNIIDFVGGIPGRVVKALVDLASFLGSVARDAWNGFQDAAATVVEGIIDFVGGIPGRVVSALGDVGSLLYNAGKKIIDGLLNGIKDAFGSVTDFVGGIGGKIVDLKGPIPEDKKMLIPAGIEIMGGLERGLRSQIPELEATLASVTDAIRTSTPAQRNGMQPMVAETNGDGRREVVHIDHAEFNDPVDIDALFGRANAALRI